MPPENLALQGKERLWMPDNVGLFATIILLLPMIYFLLAAPAGFSYLDACPRVPLQLALSPMRRDGLNTRSTCRLSALSMPMRAIIMVGPLSSTTRSRASTVACQS